MHDFQRITTLIQHLYEILFGVLCCVPDGKNNNDGSAHIPVV